VRASLPDEFADGDWDERFAEFHETRHDQVGVETLPQFVHELQHHLIAFPDARTVGENQNACFSLHGLVV
jgi:hypothetical protein